MIARTWRGWTRKDDASEYVAYVEQTGMQEYRATEGNRGAWLLWHDQGDLTEILTFTLWESREAIERFAGKDIDQAVFYPEDDRFLVKREETVTHWNVSPPPSNP